MLYEKIVAECAKLESQIQELQAQLAVAPSEELSCARDRKYIKWYIRDERGRIPLKKSMREFAEQLAIKKYLTAQCNDLVAEQKALNAYLERHQPSTTDSLLAATSPYRELLLSHFHPASEAAKHWMQGPYQTNPKHPEHLKHKSFSGNYVRSKSELIIDTALYLHHIPYRYECELQLDDLTVYPDFTICHPQTADIYYYEHFGMMDNPAYAKKAYAKLSAYAEHGIIPSHNLIVTFETSKEPLTPDIIERIIETYFL